MKLLSVARHLALCCAIALVSHAVVAATDYPTAAATSYSSSLSTVTPSGWAATDGSYAYLYWSSVSGAYNYGIYRSTSSTFSWSTAVRVGETYNTYFYDYTAKKGTTYYYWIATGSTTQWFVTGSKYLKITMPSDDLSTVAPTSVTSASDGSYAYLTWPSVSGAYNYGIYRSTSSTFSWSTAVRVGSTFNTYYYDYTVTKGKTYYYWIATGSVDKWYVGTSKWKSVTIKNPTLDTVAPTSVTSASDGSYAYMYWPSVSGAYNYGIYRSTSSTFSWSTAVRVGSTFSTYFYDYTVTKGKTYYYWIATGSVDKWYVGTSKWKSVYINDPIPITPPQPTASLNSYTGYIKVTWPSVSGCNNGYVVFRSTSSTWSWSNTRMTTTYNLYYYDTTATPGVKYYYWVCPRDATYTYANASKYDWGIRALNASTTSPYCTASYSGYVKVTWNKVTGCTSGYVVYRSTSPTFSWNNRIALMSGTTYYDTTATPGVKYYYWIGPTTRDYIYVNSNTYDWGKRTY